MTNLGPDAVRCVGAFLKDFWRYAAKTPMHRLYLIVVFVMVVVGSFALVVGMEKLTSPTPTLSARPTLLKP